jgi:hypothetical protein
MFRLIIEYRGYDGLNQVSADGFYNLILYAASYPATQQIDMGAYTSLANAKSFAATVFQASLSWTDAGTGSQSAVFTA